MTGPMSDRPKFAVRKADVSKIRPAPPCWVCGRLMWWHGRSKGWACPDHPKAQVSRR